MTSRPKLHRTDAAADDAVQQMIDRLQTGYDTGHADTYDSMFADDILWGSPKGIALQGYTLLNSIHRTMMTGTPVSPASRFELVHTLRPAPGIAVAQIRRTALNGGFSEMALYLLVERDGQWWLAAGQNTPVNEQLPSAAG